MILHHHDRLDGQGYPGAAGQEIDLPTRVLTVCDVYDALVSKPVYREAWSRESALDLLRREAGTAFDPGCVAALEDVIAREIQERETARGPSPPFPVPRRFAP